MANPTTNFGWVMPTSSSLVTNLPADFNTFGQAVDTSMSELLGGTTGQVLSKTSNTNMDFTWVTPTDQTPLTTKGDLFTFSTVDARLAVGTNGQTLVANSSTSTGLEWQTPASGMTNPMTTTGDTIYSSSGSTPARLGIGTTGQVLTVSGGVPTWATASAAAQTFTLISTTSLSGSTTTVTGLSGKNQLYFFIDGASMSGAGQDLNIRFNSDSGNNYKGIGTLINGSTLSGVSDLDGASLFFAQQGGDAANTVTGYLMLDGANATTNKPFSFASRATGTSNRSVSGMGRYTGTSVISSVSVIAGSGTFDAGSILVFGA
jgi:hypothetical protein